MKIKCIALVLGALAATTIQAAPVSLDANFSFGWSGGHNYTGNIKGTDTNADGFLTKNEITSIFESYSGHNDVNSLYDIGSINLAAHTWTPNGVSWQGYPNTAFLTFDNQIWSCTTYNGCDAIFTSFDVSNGNNVPEPASMALLGLGLAGIAIAKRKMK